LKSVQTLGLDAVGELQDALSNPRQGVRAPPRELAKQTPSSCKKKRRTIATSLRGFGNKGKGQRNARDYKIRYLFLNRQGRGDGAERGGNWYNVVKKGGRGGDRCQKGEKCFETFGGGGARHYGDALSPQKRERQGVWGGSRGWFITNGSKRSKKPG